ncbi:MAG: hypothetical protein ABIZ05_07980 [Pseudonocardiaceae bacterium]
MKRGTLSGDERDHRVGRSRGAPRVIGLVVVVAEPELPAGRRVEVHALVAECGEGERNGRASARRGAEHRVGRGRTVGQPEAVVVGLAGCEVLGERVHEELVGATDAAVLLRHHAHQLPHLGRQRPAVVLVEPKVDEHRPGRLGGELARDRHLLCRVSAEAKPSADHRDLCVGCLGVSVASPRRGRETEGGQRASAVLEGGAAAHPVPAQERPEPLLLLTERHVRAICSRCPSPPSHLARPRRPNEPKFG